MAVTLKPLKGILPALITPFGDDGKVRMDLYEKLLDRFVAAGVHGFFVAGTTAEGAMLTSEERISLFRAMKDHTSEKHLRCVVIIRPDTPDVMREIDRIAPMSPDYISAVAPYYLGADQGAIIGHYTRIAEHSPVPVLLYNIPQNTHNPIAPETVQELSAHPNIAGIKDSTGNFMQFQKALLSSRSNGFTWIQGDDLLDAPSFLMGCRCIVTGLSNVWPDPYVAMYDAALSGDFSRVISEQEKINTLSDIFFRNGGKVIPAIKAAAALQGFSTGRMRVQGMELDPAGQKVVEEILKGLGLI